MTGENDGARSDAVRAYVADFVSKYGDMAIEKLDGEEAGYEQMLGAVQSVPFLVERKLIILRGPGKNKDFAEHFQSFVDGVSETNDVLIVEAKLDKRLAYYKQLKKLTDFREFSVLDAMGLARFAVDYAKEQGGSISAADARLLVDRVGANQLIVQNELDKLLAHDTKISRASIELLTEQTPQSTVFDLLDAAFAGNRKRAAELYAQQRKLQVEPQQILAMIIWQMHILALVKTAGERGADDIARQAKISPYTVKKTVPLARRTSYARLKELLTMLRDIDVRLKSEAMNADDAVQYFLLRLNDAE